MRQKCKEYLGISFEPLKLIVTYICLFLGGCILLILANLFPSERIRQNIATSVDEFITEGNYPYMGVRKTSYALDNWTEAVLLSFYYTSNSDHPIYSAFVATAYSPKDTTGVERLQYLLSDDAWEESSNLVNRSSYWLGYGIFLRPMLFFFDYQTCRMLLSTTAYVMLIVTVVLMAKKLGTYMAIGFGTTITIFHYYALSLQYTLGIFCVFIVFAAILYLLYNKSRINYFYFMFIIGIASSFFEWLSIPLITFGMPVLIMLELARKEKPDYPFAKYFNIVFQSGAGWCLGYGIMVISKTIAAMSVIGTEAWDYFLQRFSDNSSTIQLRSFIKILLNLVRCVFPFNMIDGNWEMVLVLAVILLFWFAMIICFQKIRNLNSILLLLAAAPFAWYWVFKGHVGHVGIEFRTLMISYYSGWMFLGTVFGYVRKRLFIGDDQT